MRDHSNILKGILSNNYSCMVHNVVHNIINASPRKTVQQHCKQHGKHMIPSRNNTIISDKQHNYIVHNISTW